MRFNNVFHMLPTELRRALGLRVDLCGKSLPSAEAVDPRTLHGSLLPQMRHHVRGDGGPCVLADLLGELCLCHGDVQKARPLLHLLVLPRDVVIDGDGDPPERREQRVALRQEDQTRRVAPPKP